MNGFEFSFANTRLVALGDSALWWPSQSLLCVSDMHLGKSERYARRGGSPLPPYEALDTLARLNTLLARYLPERVVSLGDTFDDLAAADALHIDARDQLMDMVQHHSWIWIQGNHDPAATPFGGQHLDEYETNGLTFRHIAQQTASGEISGHYHPKARVGRVSRPAFLVDRARVIMPAFGTYTGGLRSSDPAFHGLMGDGALAILTGKRPLPVPMPR